MKPKVFLTRALPDAAIQRLSQQTDLTINPHDRVLTRQELMQGVEGKDGLLCLLTDRIDAEVMDAGPGLKVIADYAVGYNNIDVEAATSRGIPVSNTPGVLTESTADMAFALLLACARRVAEGDRFVRRGAWKGWGPMQFLGTDVHGARLGILGFGRIGQAVARRGHGFGMNVFYWNRTRLQAADEDRMAVNYLSLEELLRTSDFLSIHVAYNPETHHLIDRKALSLMKQSSFLINTARGAVVDESALVHALKEKNLAGAGLDVYENEPQIEKELLTLEQVVLAPHLGSATMTTRTKMAMIAIDNLLAVLSGTPAPNIVNREALIGKGVKLP